MRRAEIRSIFISFSVCLDPNILLRPLNLFIHYRALSHVSQAQPAPLPIEPDPEPAAQYEYHPVSEPSEAVAVRLEAPLSPIPSPDPDSPVQELEPEPESEASTHEHEYHDPAPVPPRTRQAASVPRAPQTPVRRSTRSTTKAAAPTPLAEAHFRVPGIEAAPETPGTIQKQRKGQLPPAFDMPPPDSDMWETMEMPPPPPPVATPAKGKGKAAGRARKAELA